MDAPKDPRLLLLWNLYSTERDDPDEVREDLEEMGYDPDLLARRGKELLREVRGRVELELDAERTRRRSEQADRLRERLRMQLDAEPDPKAALLAMLPRTASEGQAVFFRKIESLSVEDALEILSDTQLLKMLEENPDAPENDNPHGREDPDER